MSVPPKAAEKDLFLDKSAAALDEEARKIKKTKDYTQELDTALETILPVWENDHSKYLEVIKQILPWEKRCRLASDVKNTTKSAVLILKICAESNEYQKLCDYLAYLCRCRAQLIAVMKAVVEKALEVSQNLHIDDKEELVSTQLLLLTSIIDVSKGKLCVEYESATATIIKMNVLLSQNKKAEAYKLILSIPAEVIGSMSYYEKCVTILNQVQHCINNDNLLQAKILLQKIRLSEINEWFEIKVCYYMLLATINYKKDLWLDSARACFELFLLFLPIIYHVPTGTLSVQKAQQLADISKSIASGDKSHIPKLTDLYGKTPLSTLYYINVNDFFKSYNSSTDDATDDVIESTTSSNNNLWRQWLQRASICTVLAPYDYESEQLLQQIVSHRQVLSQCTTFYLLLKQLTNKLFMAWPLKKDNGCWSTTIDPDLTDESTSQIDSFHDDLLQEIESDDFFNWVESPVDTPATIIASEMSDDVPQITTTTKSIIGNKPTKLALLRQRVIQHNLRLVADRYTTIPLSRAAQRVGIEVSELEDELLLLSLQHVVRIDRPLGVIKFTDAENDGKVTIERWSNALEDLFQLVENTDQFIQKTLSVELSSK